MFIETFPEIAKSWRYSSSTSEWINGLQSCSPFILQGKETTDRSNNLDEPPENYAEWEKEANLQS